MPELPEVETVGCEHEPLLSGYVIASGKIMVEN